MAMIQDQVVPSTGHLVVWHHLPCPLHRTDAGQQDGETETETHPQVLRVRVEQSQVDVSFMGDEEVADHKGERRDGD